MTDLPIDQNGLAIVTSDVGGAHVLKLTGFVDLSTVPIIDAAIEGFAENPPKLVVFDLLDVDFLGSAGLSALARVHSYLGSDGRLIVVANDVTARPIRLTGLDRVFEVRGAIDEVFE